jgi:hypothetical protein
MVLSIKIKVFCDVTPCSLVGRLESFPSFLGSDMKILVACSFEVLVPVSQATWNHILDDYDKHRYEVGSVHNVQVWLLE